MAVLKSIFLLALYIFRCESMMESGKVPQMSKAEPLTLAQWPSYNVYEPNGPGTYAFGYEIDDPATGNVQFRDEEKLENGTVKGSYGYLRPDGFFSLTRYIADEMGYRSTTETFKKPSKKVVNTTNTTPSMTDDNNGTPEVTSDELAQSVMEQHQIDLNPSNDPAIQESIIDPDVAAIINGVHPLAMISGNKGGSSRRGNSPSNKLRKSNGAQMKFHNDKFYNPLNTEQNNKKEASMMAETKEAVWYKELIRSRRKEFLQKYSKDYYNQIIPADYSTSNSL